MSSSIPIRISPFFFLTAGLIGFINSQSLIGTLLWIIVIFISILVHEFGHALSAKTFGQHPQIQLTALGGLTYAATPKLSLPKEFIVVLAGPLFGFALFFVTWGIIKSGFFTNPVVLYTLEVSYWINLIWTILNLLPVLPLDGGQLMRILFEGIFGFKGRKGAFITSMCISIIGALFFIFLQFYIIAILLFMFAFQNFEYARQMRIAAKDDENEELKSELSKAEQLFLTHRVVEASSLLEEIREKTKEGMIFQIATQDLAKLKLYQKQFHEAYGLLKPHLKQLTDTGKLLLQQAAFEEGDFDTTLALSGNCLLSFPDSDLMLRAAAAAASLGDKKAALGWLQTAKDYGCENLKGFLNERYFDSIREAPEFQTFQEHLG